MKAIDKKIDDHDKKISQSKEKKKLLGPKPVNAYSIPALQKYAEMHEKATRFARPDQMAAVDFKKTLCPCCLLPTRNTPLNSCTPSLKAIGKISRSIKEYFQYLIFMMCVFFIVFMMSCLPHIIVNPPIVKCVLTGCSSSLEKLKEYFDTIHDGESFETNQFSIMCLATVLTLFVAKYLFFYFMYRQHKRNDAKRKTPGDYTVHAHNLKGKKKSEIVFEICDQLKDSKVAIRGGRQEIKLSEYYISEISSIHNISNLTDLTMGYMQMMKDEKKYRTKGEYNSKKYKNLKKKMEAKKTEIDRITKTGKKTNFTGEAFVTFTSLDIPPQIINNEWKVLWKKYFSKKIYYLKAHEPSDIIWGNFGISGFNRIMRIIFSYLIAILLVGLSFLAIYWVKKFQKNTKSKVDDKTETFLNKARIYGFLGIITFIIILINFILRQIMIILSRKEYRKFFTEFEYSKVFKVSFALFMNSGIIILITTNSIMEKNAYNALFDTNGIVINIQLLMLISLTTPFLWTITNPFHFLKWIKRRMMIKKLKDPKNNILQLEANTAFERNLFTLDFRYYSILKTTAIAFFYAPVIPFGLLLAGLEMIIWFICDKILVVNRISKPKDLNFVFTLEMLSYFDIFLVLLPLGNIIFQEYYFDADINNPMSIAALVLTLLEAFVIRINVLFKCCKCCVQFEEQDIDYAKIKKRFKSYRQTNPMTSQIYRFDKKNKKMISKKDLDGKKPDPGSEGTEGDDNGEINLFNIIHMIGTQGLTSGDNRMYVQDQAYAYQELQGDQQQGNYNPGMYSNDINPYNQGYANINDLILNQQVDLYMDYNNNYFDDNMYNQNLQTYNQQPVNYNDNPNMGDQNVPVNQNQNANFFDTVFNEFGNLPADNYFQDQNYGNQQPMNTIGMGQPNYGNPIYTNPNDVQNTNLVQDPNNYNNQQQFFPGNYDNTNGNSYPDQGYGNDQPNYNNYAQGGGGYDNPQQGINYGDTGMYDNNQANPNYFDPNNNNYPANPNNNNGNQGYGQPGDYGLSLIHI